MGEVILAPPPRDVVPFVEEGAVTARGPNRFRVVLGSWSWPALAVSVARFDADVEVVGPPELADACGRLGRRFLAAQGATSAPRDHPGRGDRSALVRSGT